MEECCITPSSELSDGGGVASCREGNSPGEAGRESHGVAVCTPRQQQQHQQQQLQHEVEEKADAEEQRGVNACSIREKSHDRRLAMCSRDVQKGDRR